jgi:hypothetical protein
MKNLNFPTKQSVLHYLKHKTEGLVPINKYDFIIILPRKKNKKIKMHTGVNNQRKMARGQK